MEEQSPDAQPAGADAQPAGADAPPKGRRAPRARTPKPDFTPPVVDPAEQSTAGDKPDSGARPPSRPARPRRAPATIAPVLFQPPTAPPLATPPAAQPLATPPAAQPPAPESVPEKAPARKTTAKKSPVKKAPVKKAPAKKAAPKKAVPRKTAAKKPEPEAAATTAPPAANESTEAPLVSQPPQPISEPTPSASEPPIAPASVPHRTFVRLMARPDHAPELLALAAVDAIGPAAKEWAARLRHEYPAATDDALARLAVRRFVRLGGLGAAAATGAGLLAPVVELAAVGWTEAALVLHVAAAYQMDPTEPERAVELLVLALIHPDDESARAAVDRASRTVPDSADLAVRLVDAAQRIVQTVAGPAGLSGGWALVRAAARLLPGARVLAASAGDMMLLERLAARATAHYRQAGTATSTPAAVTAS
ncbi:hypothetical protein O7632_01390 [Solwaraspora sp. WMMD406]|uniref:hypothetical protein n=1 Tax=Solwaraspora sp. WMMD406 TaxID=3016095 RepID=UPI0024176607|nr:hypothetical protein [Solwaraspora sp. WMMD406]MDG4762777.1 hypothetical protein [Solwaraspora sp. WMMD406]